MTTVIPSVRYRDEPAGIQWLFEAGLGALLLLCACSRPSLPATEQLTEQLTLRSDSAEIVGDLRWEILDCESGAVLSRATRQVLARDVVIIQTTDKSGEVSFDKRIELEKGFYIEMAEFPEEARDELDGFAIVAGRRGVETFSWEWFDIKGDSRAPKRQEGGELVYALVSVDSRWEVARTEVTSDVSLRIDKMGVLSGWRTDPAWRIRLEKGSYVNWPSVSNGEIRVHQSGKQGKGKG